MTTRNVLKAHASRQTLPIKAPIISRSPPNSPVSRKANDDQIDVSVAGVYFSQSE